MPMRILTAFTIVLIHFTAMHAAEPAQRGQAVSPADIANCLCFWNFQAGEDRLRSHGKYQYELRSMNGEIESVPGGVFGETALKVKPGQWMMIPGDDCPGLDLHGDDHVTVVAWIQRDATRHWQYIAGVWNELHERRQYALFTCGHRQANEKTLERVPCENRAHGYVSDVGGATPGKPFCFSYATGKTEIPKNEWVMIAFTYDHQSLRVYYDGKLDRQKDFNPFAWDKPIFHPEGKPTAFTVAQRGVPRWPGYPEQVDPQVDVGFSGLLSGLAVYDRALKAEELASLHQSTLGK